MIEEKIKADNILAEVKYPWLKRLVLPNGVVLILIFAVSGMEFSEGPLYLLLVYGIISYFFFEQFYFTNVLLTEDKLIVKYPISFMIKTKEFDLNEIESIMFNFNPGPYGLPFFKVKCGRKTRKVFCVAIGDLQPLIDLMKSREIEVELRRKK